MNDINTETLEKCLKTLKKSFLSIKAVSKNSDDYEMLRNSLVESFEMTLEQSRKLLRRKLLPFFVSKKEIDQLTFKDTFRHAFQHGLIEEEEAKRWLQYRDNRNSTTHDYGQSFAEETLKLTEQFIKDAEKLKGIIEHD